MSLVATCPQCHTAFIVKPEHLAARRGEVRCGQCRHRFNALQHLSEIVSDDLAPIPVADSPHVADGEPVSVPQHATPELLPVQAHHHETATSGDQPPVAPIPAGPLPAPPAEPPPPAAPELIPEPSSDILPQQAAAMPENASPTFWAAPAVEPLPPLTAANASQRSPFFLVWAMGCLLLIILAIAQTAYFKRTELAARAPLTRPWLELACHHVGCTIPLPHEMDAIQIEDSDLHEDSEHPGVVVLSSTLINHAPYAQAFPQLELTLTDLEDRAILRRVFNAREYLGIEYRPESGIPPEGEVHVSLTLTTGDTKPAGYRVYISYPENP